MVQISTYLSYLAQITPKTVYIYDNYNDLRHYTTHLGEKLFVFFAEGGLRLTAPSRVISGSGISRTALLFTDD